VLFLDRAKKFFIALYSLWLIPVVSIVLAYFLWFSDVSVVYVLAIITFYALVWYRLADEVITRYAIPRSEKYAEIIAEMYGLRKVDPRLAYFLYHWLSPILKREERRGKMAKALEFKKIMIPTGDRERVRREVRRRKSLREIYEEAARLGRELLAQEASEAPSMVTGQSEVREETGVEEESEEATISEAETGAELSEDLNALSVVFSQRGLCFLRALMSMASQEFSIRSLAQLCNAHWETARDWVDAALKLGFVRKVGSRRYVVNRERLENVMRSILPSEEEGR